MNEINLLPEELRKEKKVKKERGESEAKLYIPEKEKSMTEDERERARKERRALEEKKKREAEEKERAIAAMAKELKPKTEKKKKYLWLAIGLGGLVLLLGIIAVELYLAGFFKKPSVQIPTPPVEKPVVAPSVLPPENLNANIAPPVVTPPEIPVPPPPVVIPPPTELAPLRGALVEFSTSTDVFLIDNDGTLRKIESDAIIFKNGQNLKQLRTTRVYRINDKWSSARKGQEITNGIEFDPRILMSGELEPFK